jgi:hypothetical protein
MGQEYNPKKKKSVFGIHTPSIIQYGVLMSAGWFTLAPPPCHQGSFWLIDGWMKYHNYDVVQARENEWPNKNDVHSGLQVGEQSAYSFVLLLLLPTAKGDHR